METKKNIEFTFPVGFYDFHKKHLFNFQMNRWYSWGYTNFEDLLEVFGTIKTFEDWKRQMLYLAEKALRDNRLLNAAFYYRSAEFYALFNDPEKEELYDKFSELFYKAIEADDFQRHQVPYDGVKLPALEVQAKGDVKGTIVLFGGFDSYMEEFYSWMRYLSNHGFRVVAFEGPGQGAALKKQGLEFDLEWEKPVKAVLNYLDLEDVTVLGISLGGYYCFRAAAFEPRIKKVIACGVAFDFMQGMSAYLRKMHIWFIKYFRNFSNKMAMKGIEHSKTDSETWMTSNMMYITRQKEPMAAFEKFMLKINERNLHSNLVKQDVLILTGRNDHFIPFKLHKLQVKALINAKSVTPRVFIKEEKADQHCQIGNAKLALDTMINWIIFND